MVESASDAARLDEPGLERDRAAGRRDDQGEARDVAGVRRDEASGERDALGNRRDLNADQRDNAAEARDRRAERADGRVDRQMERGRAAAARLAAASDRAASKRDRNAAASDRAQSGQDRTKSHADQEAGTEDRSHAGLDRRTARIDRESSADERQRAAFDPMTGTYTRGAGLLELEREMARSQRTGEPLTVAFVDIDDLKAVNDSRGHGAGDRLITRVAERLQCELRDYDLIIRYGGDEFLCVIQGLDVASAQTRVEAINQALAGGTDGGSISVGLAQLRPGDTVARIVDRADKAMYDGRTLHRHPIP